MAPHQGIEPCTAGFGDQLAIPEHGALFPAFITTIFY